ncbi:MAG: amidohydrolase family protein [Clostridia bacterium]|nr:amidohydrolase family protein [Clostridia bacterium]
MKKIDFHVHLDTDEISVEDSARYFNEMCERKGYEGVGLMALSHCSEAYHPQCNERALAIKVLMPGSVAFGSPHHSGDFVEQVEDLMGRGFSGIKLLGGKPSQYRLFGYSYEHERYEKLFAYCEKYGVPLMVHNNDPLVHWDITKASPRTIARGWVYDEKIPSQEWFFLTMEAVLARHPRLKIALAHFGFYSNDLPRATALMEKYPNLMMDITPAPPIYVELSSTQKESEAFFRKYHDRILFGTDVDNALFGRVREYNDMKTEMIGTFLEGSEPRMIDGRFDIRPISLEPHMLENIYYNNAMRFIGKA